MFNFRGPQMGGQTRRGWIWRFWGAPIFRPEVPEYLFLRALGTLEGKSGPQKRQIQPRRIWPPICGPLTIIAQLLRNSCALKPWKTREVLGNQLFMGTIALPSVSDCVAFCELFKKSYYCVSSSDPFFGGGPNTVSESTVSNTELSELFCSHRVPGREHSEFLSAYYLYDKANSPSFSLNSPSLPPQESFRANFNPKRLF